MDTSTVGFDPACCFYVVVVRGSGGAIRPNVHVHLIFPRLGMHKPRVVGQQEGAHPQGVHLGGKKGKGTFLYSAVSSPLDRSRCFVHSTP